MHRRTKHLASGQHEFPTVPLMRTIRAACAGNDLDGWLLDDRIDRAVIIMYPIAPLAVVFIAAFPATIF